LIGCWRPHEALISGPKEWQELIVTKSVVVNCGKNANKAMHDYPLAGQNCFAESAITTTIVISLNNGKAQIEMPGKGRGNAL